jgi:glycosyltransferase involved in cell wall biosynthesis
MKKKNVLIFLNAFWNNGKGMTGGDQMLIQVFKRIRNDFGKIRCYTSNDGKKVISQYIESVDFFVSNKFFDRLNIILNYILRTIKAMPCLRFRDVDILYGGSDFFPDVIPLFLFKLFHKKAKWFQCVFHIYPDWKKRPGSKLKNFLAQYFQKLSLLLAKKSDVIININYQVKEELIRRGFDGNKIVVNTPGIDLGYFSNLKISEKEKKYDAAFLARLNPSKGIFDLIEIWENVVKEKKDAKLAIIGGGSDEIKKKMQDKIRDKVLEKNVDILGFLENDRSFSLIKNSKVFLFPSHEEGFGIAIAEAMACGVPVIAWNLPVYDEIFENSLIQISENDFHSFSDKATELLKNNDLRNYISEKSSNFIKKYDWDEIAKKHLEILST